MAITTGKFLQLFEVPIDANAGYKNDHWTNRDLIPMPSERRTYAIWSYFVYWCISGMCISAYTTGSTLLSYGLTAQQAIVALVVGALFTGFLHHIGFTVASRFTWGMRGAYFPILIRSFTWDGLQAFWGGQAVIPGEKSTLAGGILMLKDFIGMIIYYLLFITIMHIPPERLQRPFVVSSIMFSGTLIGLLVWAVSNVHGPGPLFKGEGEPANGSIGWAMMFGITAILGSWGGGTLGQSDWTRYANRPYAPTLSQLIAAPFTIIVSATIGIIVTSCAQQILGELVWKPFQLLSALQDYYDDSRRARCGVFFAGLGCVCAQLGISIVLNSVSAGMDLARYMNIRRGAYLLAVLGLASNPWQYLSNASTFLTVLSGFGTFLAPFTGIILADYLVLEDCYIGNSTSVYWYWHGFHWRALAAWLIGVFPTMPGLVITVKDPAAYNGWVRTFHITFFVGLSVSFAAYWLICMISKPPGLRIGTGQHDERMFKAVEVSNVEKAGVEDIGDRVVVMEV
ncbi:permease for cytosine/purines, uracil, thiamine, allantoin-domain-containing protein [Fomitopsis betulina]|nr:permease for cytosine/purines, uracil, thiamine, allantoin-domain-containing protein [Fomitopsis betulina]